MAPTDGRHPHHLPLDELHPFVLVKDAGLAYPVIFLDGEVLPPDGLLLYRIHRVSYFSWTGARPCPPAPALYVTTGVLMVQSCLAVTVWEYPARGNRDLDISDS
jgi:hypothetical protein